MDLKIQRRFLKNIIMQVREPATKKEKLIKRCVAQFGRALRSGRRGCCLPVLLLAGGKR
ncbi:MAG: hypothetical protein J6P57_02130 [Lachnospiraceae bacterium]|nr:hypothetical protein [Lachnospiraceae bacterium]